MRIPKAGRAVVGVDGETGAMTVAVRSIWAPAIIALRQTLGLSLVGAVGCLAAGGTLGAAKAIAYVVLVGAKPAVSCSAVWGPAAVAWNTAT